MDDAKQSMLKACAHLTHSDLKHIDTAYHLALKAHEGQKRRDGKPYIEHPIAVAEILCGWNADAETVMAGLLHDAVEDTPVSIEQIENTFGEDVASLVESVTKFTQADFAEKSSLDDEVETLRRLFEVMRTDIRSVIVKIADRLHNLRTIEGLSEARRISFAKESVDIYYKIAYHLGMNEVCREIMNICIPYLYPHKAEIRMQHWKEQKSPMEEAQKQIQKDLKKSDQNSVVLDVRLVKSSHDLPRPLDEDESADRAYYIVLIVKDVDSCYSVFKTLHKLYRPVRRKFHDYIASTPESGYQSLHTTVVGPADKRIQVRIRTEQMDEQVRHGVLLSAFEDDEDDMRMFSWLRRSEELDRTTRESSEAFWDALQSDIFQKSMEVVVNGMPVSVPQQSTALDAVYLQMGTEANKTYHIKLNGKEVEFAEILNEDDVLEVKLSRTSEVHFEWLQYITTKYARTQIVEVLKELEQGERFALGQNLLQKELDHFGKTLVGEIPKHQQEHIAEHFGRKKMEDVIVMVGEGVITARDVIFAMEKKPRKNPSDFKFRLNIKVQKNYKDQIIPQVSTMARLHDISIVNINMNPANTMGILSISLRGSALSKAHYADFLASLDRHSWISSMKTLINKRQIALMTSTIITAFFALIAAYFGLIHARVWFSGLPIGQNFLAQLLIVAPSAIANFYLVRALRHYIAQLRNDRLFLALIILLNISTCSLIVYHNVVTRTYNLMLPFVSVFMFFIAYIAYHFITTEQIFSTIRKEELRPLSKKEWAQLKKKKMMGYLFRLGAVTIWGIQPLYLRYTPASEVAPIVRVFLTGVGVLLITLVFVFLRRLSQKKKKKAIRLPKDILFFNIIIGYILFTYFLNASLQFTTSTNFILFNNFSPVIALLIGAALWRSSIPYLKEPQKMLWIFLIFLLGSTGAAMIIYNSVQGYSGGSPYGDMLGIMAMAADTVLVVSQIRYMKLHDKVSSLSINLYVFFSHIVIMVPVLAVLYFTGNPAMHSLAKIPVLFGIGAGILAGIGQILNYETFRRIDGFIAFLMFNISILITFVIEVFFLGQFEPSWILMVGGTVIIASTILAEVINSYCQKKGL